MVTWLYITLAAILAERLAEIRLARSNREWMLKRGAKEYGAGHYPLFIALHSLWLLAWFGEVVFGGAHPGKYWVLWLILFLSAQAARYWCIATLGKYWNTRILVIPGAALISHGPYKYLRHPNYIAVSAELACGPLIFGAEYTAALILALNLLLIIKIRLPAEEKALGQLKT